MIIDIVIVVIQVAMPSIVYVISTPYCPDFSCVPIYRRKTKCID